MPHRDGRITFWSRKDRRLTAELWLFRPSREGDTNVEWLLKAGRYYTGSPGVEKHILWRKGNMIYAGNRFVASLRNPLAVCRALAGRID